jgi:hypothetical protein
MSEKTKLHFTRIRAKGEPSFFDPQTDIRQLFPAVAKAAIMTLQDQNPGDKELQHDLTYIHNCLCIFQIRIAEDTAPVADQVAAFCKALDKCRSSTVSLLKSRFFTMIMMLFALFCRRDAKVDKDQLSTMMSMIQLAPLSTMISKELFQQVQEELTANAPAKLHDVCYPDGCNIMCEETQQQLKGAKDIIRLFVSASGDTSWEALAAACDEAFSTPGIKSDAQNIALALAYPDYEHPSLSVEVEAEHDSL